MADRLSSDAGPEHSMILLLMALALLQVALLMPAWVYSRRHGRLFSWDYSLAVVILYYARVFYFDCLL